MYNFPPISRVWGRRKERERERRKRCTRCYPARACGDERSPIELRLTEEWPAPFI